MVKVLGAPARNDAPAGLALPVREPTLLLQRPAGRLAKINQTDYGRVVLAEHDVAGVEVAVANVATE